MRPLRKPASPTVADHDLTTRMRAVAEVCNRAAAGDLEARAEVDATDPEFAALCSSINRMLDMADAFVRESSAAMDHCSRDLYHRPVLERGLKGAYRLGAATINGAILKMREQHDARLQTALLAAETATQLGTVAAACEQLSSSGREITGQAGDSVSHTRTAVTEAGRAKATVGALLDAARQINAMVALISKIASQTNLLALNATIEAARAGEVGKGFAVVASEVKALSRNTAEATTDIDQQVAQVLQGVAAVSSCIEDIHASIRRIDENATVISDSVGEQVRAIAEIAQSVTAVSDRTNQITRRMGADRAAPAQPPLAS